MSSPLLQLPEDVQYRLVFLVEDDLNTLSETCKTLLAQYGRRTTGWRVMGKKWRKDLSATGLCGRFQRYRGLELLTLCHAHKTLPYLLFSLGSGHLRNLMRLELNGMRIPFTSVAALAHFGEHGPRNTPRCFKNVGRLNCAPFTFKVGVQSLSL